MRSFRVSNVLRLCESPILRYNESKRPRQSLTAEDAENAEFFINDRTL